MFPKLSMSNIVRDHLNSLKYYARQSDIVSGNNGRHTFKCFFAFIIIPLAFTYVLYEPDGRIEDSVIGLILNANSIFIALLLNLIVLLYSMKEKLISGESESKKGLRKQLIKYTFANVSFQILLSLSIVVLTLLHGQFTNEYIVTTFDTLIIFLMIQVVLGVVLILSRLSKLFAVN